ncbi:UNVERIFIED_CONTAM: hypothetical protein FKN15_073658 [Acipenser sinensis]
MNSFLKRAVVRMAGNEMDIFWIWVLFCILAIIYSKVGIASYLNYCNDILESQQAAVMISAKTPVIFMGVRD